MERIYRPGEWINARVMTLSKDETLRTIYRAVLDRTIGEAADDLNFPFDRYMCADKIGRPEKADVVGQWLCAERRHDEGAFDERKLAEFLQEADLDTLWTHAGERLDELGAKEMLPALDGDEKTIKTHPNGWSVVSILTPEGARNEYHRSGLRGVAMADDQDFLYVIRNRDGGTEAMLTGYEGVLMRVVGRGRTRVPTHMAAEYILPLVLELGLELDKPGTIHGHIQTSDGLIHDFRNIPENSTIEGDFDIVDPEEARLISRLPDGLWVKGWFGVVGATYLTATPRGMRVDGQCTFIDCSGLKTVSEGLRVGMSTEISRCHSIDRIEGSVDFGQCLSIPADLKELRAEPFRAQEVRATGADFTGDDQSYVKRDVEGRVLLTSEALDKMLKAKLRSEVASLPGHLARIAVHEVKFRARSGIWNAKRALKNVFSPEKAPDDGGSKPRL